MLETLVRRLHMVRLSAAAPAFMTAMVAMGCTGLVDGATDGLTTEQAAAKRAWLEKGHPVVAAFCVGCHDGSRANIGFLEGANPVELRDDLVAFEPSVVNLTAPQSSRLLTKGIHEGPALTASQASDLLEWIQKEKDAAENIPGEETPTLETDKFLPLICTAGAPGDPTCPYNDVSLDTVGLAGIPGAKIQFTAQALGSGLYVSNLKLLPGPMGAKIEHPLFVSHPEGAAPMPDTIDRFFSVKMNLEATATDDQKQIAGGTAAFVGFLANAKLSIHFKKVSIFEADGGGEPPVRSGCQVLANFKTVRTLLTTNVGGAANNCLACHGGQNAGATGALNITGINSADDAVVLNACNQVLIRVNLTTPDSSGIFLAPDPGSTHPFRFTAAQLATYKNGPPGTGLLGWINAEKVAP